MNSRFKKPHFTHLKCSAVLNWPVSLQIWLNLHKQVHQANARLSTLMYTTKQVSRTAVRLDEYCLKCNVDTDFHYPLLRFNLILLPVSIFCVSMLLWAASASRGGSTEEVWVVDGVTLTSDTKPPPLSYPSSCKKHVWRDEGGGGREEVLHRVVE